MNQVMVDLETMGTASNAAIIAIGAVRFDPEEQKITDSFYEVIDLQSCIDMGLEIEASTVMWWMQQSKDARKEFNCQGRPISVALFNFRNWLGEDAVVWGNGAAFDNVILANAYKKYGAEQPWKFWNDRCYRTVKNLYPNVPFYRNGTYHRAVDDAESQALHLMKILKEIGGDYWALIEKYNDLLKENKSLRKENDFLEKTGEAAQKQREQFAEKVDRYLHNMR